MVASANAQEKDRPQEQAQQEEMMQCSGAQGLSQGHYRPSVPRDTARIRELGKHFPEEGHNQCYQILLASLGGVNPGLHLIVLLKNEFREDSGLGFYNHRRTPFIDLSCEVLLVSASRQAGGLSHYEVYRR